MERISVEAILNVSREDAWNIYTDPKHIVKWNAASDDWHCPKAENDLRVGGAFMSRMEAKDGSVGFDFEGTYDEVSPMYRIAYTMGDGRKAAIEFSDFGNDTQVKVSFDAEKVNSVEMQRGGWQAILNNYKEYAESIA